MGKKKPKETAKFRDRIKDFRRVTAGELAANAANWRTHPDEQRTALRAVLEEIGWAGAVVCRELKGGRLEIIDGHLRADLDPVELVPVLVTDLSEAEAAKLLAVYDPIGDLAGADPGKLREVLDMTQFANQALADLVTQLAEEHGVIDTTDAGDGGGGGADVPETYQLVIDCKDQADQKALNAEFEERGYACKVLTL